MKLIGSMVEQKFKEELLRSWKGMCSEGSVIMPILLDRFGTVKSAFVLGWTPEQGEDIYTLLVNADTVFDFEIERGSGEVLESSVSSLKEYERGPKSKTKRIQLAVALDLTKKGI